MVSKAESVASHDAIERPARLSQEKMSFFSMTLRRLRSYQHNLTLPLVSDSLAQECPLPYRKTSGHVAPCGSPAQPGSNLP